MAAPSGFISQTTLLNPQAFACEALVEKLVLAHSLLQQRASSSEGGLFLFNGMQWWYSLSVIPASFIHTQREWSTLVDDTDYRNLLQELTVHPGPEELTVEFTNNLSFISSGCSLPLASYPTAGYVLEDGSTAMMPIYPCVLRLSKIVILKFPPTACDGSDQTNETLSLVKPNTSNTDLSHCSDDSNLSSMTLLPSSDPSSPIQLPEQGKPAHEDHMLPLPLSPSEPRASLQRPYSPAYIKIIVAKSNLLFKYYVDEDDPSWIMPRTQQGLYIRSLSSTHRRYSDRFDSHTRGLNGFSRDIKSQYPSHSDVRMYLDLAQSMEDDVAIDDGGEQQSNHLLVTFERALDESDGVPTSILWTDKIYRFLHG